MQQPTLPLELQQLIIDDIGDDALLAQHSTKKPKDALRDSLGPCSLVCKAWHARTL